MWNCCRAVRNKQRDGGNRVVVAVEAHREDVKEVETQERQARYKECCYRGDSPHTVVFTSSYHHN